MAQPKTLSTRATDADASLASVEALKAQMAENFHLYQEIQNLPAADRDALFDILWRAQQGNPAALEAVYDLIFEEIPVDMEEFVLGYRYLNLKGLINPEKVDILCRVADPRVRKAFIAAGSGGGKSFIVSIMMAYMTYRLLCLRRPDLFYLLGPGSRIAIINLSISKDQARDVIFAEFKARLTHSQYFAGRYKPFRTSATFGDSVAVFSGGSNAISYYGYHTIMGSLDEASYMLDGDRVLAEELAEAVLKSMHTRFPGAYKLMVISTLRSAGDYLAQQIERISEEGVCVLDTGSATAVDLPRPAAVTA